MAFHDCVVLYYVKDTYWTCRKCHQKFRLRFPDAHVANTTAVFQNMWRFGATGSILNIKRTCRRHNRANTIGNWCSIGVISKKVVGLMFTSGRACITTNCNKTCIYIHIKQLWSVNSTKRGWILQTDTFIVILDGGMGKMILFLNFVIGRSHSPVASDAKGSWWNYSSCSAWNIGCSWPCWSFAW